MFFLLYFHVNETFLRLIFVNFFFSNKTVEGGTLGLFIFFKVAKCTSSLPQMLGNSFNYVVSELVHRFKKSNFSCQDEKALREKTIFLNAISLL